MCVEEGGDEKKQSTIVSGGGVPMKSRYTSAAYRTTRKRLGAAQHYGKRSPTLSATSCFAAATFAVLMPSATIFLALRVCFSSSLSARLISCH